MRVRAALWGAEKKIKRARQQTARPPEEGGLQAPFMGLANPSLQFIDTALPGLSNIPDSTVSYRSASRQNRVLSLEIQWRRCNFKFSLYPCVESQDFRLVEVRVRSAPGAVPLLLVVAVDRLVLIEIPESPLKGWMIPSLLSASSCSLNRTA